jgi:hypothetical protein
MKLLKPLFPSTRYVLCLRSKCCPKGATLRLKFRICVEQLLKFRFSIVLLLTASVVDWSVFLATDPEVPGLIPGATRFSEK